MFTFNPTSNQEYRFDDKTMADYAVAYGYCEENNLMSALLAAVVIGRFGDFTKLLPLVVSKEGKSVSCGNWLAMVPEYQRHMMSKYPGF